MVDPWVAADGFSYEVSHPCHFAYFTREKKLYSCTHLLGDSSLRLFSRCSKSVEGRNYSANVPHHAKSDYVKESEIDLSGRSIRSHLSRS